MSRRKRVDYVQEEYYSRMAENPNRDLAWNYEAMMKRILTELAISRFKWEGLPRTVDKRYLEYVLHFEALVVFYWDSEYDKYLALKGAGVGRMNMYNNPTKFLVNGNQELNKVLEPSECVPIWSNYMRIPDAQIVQVYAQRIANAMRTVDINMLNERHPWVVSVDKNERLSLQNAFRQVEEGQPVIWGTEAFTAESLKEKINSLNVGQDREATLNMMTVQQRLWNECMTMLGIANANTDKRERMITNEIEANNDQVLASRNISLEARREAAKQIRQRWGLDVTVEWNNSVGIDDDESLDERNYRKTTPPGPSNDKENE